MSVDVSLTAGIKRPVSLIFVLSDRIHVDLPQATEQDQSRLLEVSKSGDVSALRELLNETSGVDVNTTDLNDVSM